MTLVTISYAKRWKRCELYLLSGQYKCAKMADQEQEGPEMSKMIPTGNGLRTAEEGSSEKPEMTEEKKGCWDSVKEKLEWKPLKLIIALWLYGDVVSDALQAKTYFVHSPFWNSAWNTSKWRNGTLVEDLEFEKLELNEWYFTSALSTFFISPSHR